MKPPANSASGAPQVADPDDDDLLHDPDRFLSRREVRLSLGVIGALMIVLGVLVAKRWYREDAKVAQAAETKAAPTAGAPETTSAAPAAAEELPPLAVRPMESAPPPVDPPAMEAAPAGESDLGSPPADSFPPSPPSAFASGDSASEVGQAVLTPEQSATDPATTAEGFPDAAEAGLTAAPPTFPEPPQEEPSHGENAPALAFEPPMHESRSEATPPLTAAPPEAYGASAADPFAASASPPFASEEATPSEEHAPPDASSFSETPAAGDAFPSAAETGIADSPAVGEHTPSEPQPSEPQPSEPQPSEPQPSELRASELPRSDSQPPFEPVQEHTANEGPVDEAPAATPEPWSAPTTASPPEPIADTAPVTTAPFNAAPAATAPAAPAERQPTGQSYRVNPGDTFWTISKRAYGTGAYYQALAEYNRGIVPPGQVPAAGQTLLIPTARDLEERFPHLCPTVGAIRRPDGTPAPSMSPSPPTQTIGAPPAASQPAAVVLPRGQRTYQVKAGENLYDIAERELGSPLRWKDIYKLNRAQLGARPHDLRPGMELILPSGDDRSAAAPRIRP